MHINANVDVMDFLALVSSTFRSKRSWSKNDRMDINPNVDMMDFIFAVASFNMSLENKLQRR